MSPAINTGGLVEESCSTTARFFPLFGISERLTLGLGTEGAGEDEDEGEAFRGGFGAVLRTGIVSATNDVVDAGFVRELGDVGELGSVGTAVGLDPSGSAFSLPNAVERVRGGGGSLRVCLARDAEAGAMDQHGKRRTVTADGGQ
jgi:hypothetical protein